MMVFNKLAKRESRPTLTPWSGEFQRFFDDFWGDRWDAGYSALGNSWIPAVDVEETDNEYLLKAEMPGLKKEDVKISLADNVLTITGEKKSEERKDDKRYHRVERSYGSFQRSFALAAPIQGDRVSASFKDGILIVTVPKSEEAKPKEIDIKVD